MVATDVEKPVRTQRKSSGQSGRGGKAGRGRQSSGSGSWDENVPPSSWGGWRGQPNVQPHRGLDSQNVPWLDAWGGSGVYKPAPDAGSKSSKGGKGKGKGKGAARQGQVPPWASPSMPGDVPKTLVQESLEAAAQGGHNSQMTAVSQLTPECLLGDWADSLGNKVLVLSTDAYQIRLLATLSKPPRNDIHLQVAPILMNGAVVGWQCGNSILDPFWSSREELHWFAGNGKVSVWVRTRSRVQSLIEQSPKSQAVEHEKEQDAASERAANMFAADRAAEDKKGE